jgi:hypothetical protein
MTFRSRRVAVLPTLLASLVITAGAGGYAIASAVNVPRGGGATSLPMHSTCQNFGSRVQCQTGDAYPFVELTGTRTGGVIVKVHTLRDPQGGRLVRTYVKGYPVYVFTAF